ncbi:hypothetical protein HBI56_127310 [Parastagonospora nodorum]|uniref:Uncharacterized protein n=2 Tax=Phaeosphaeria nodorum (strain SN15 / ATCC MYA-4574 / FGSC 10173) TaxID=321614 RepID=A0A7U2I457_PHANO|nr:hypothetical protein SNOG_04753 [Parastagonospora nodorum SN15]KAH3909139.1 hypothetical protein HBH56_168680 [Parastagonospora nodorum]EAT88513.1 hypothetical protein SNOG_04753 [Parastagonospora nodorum SN15]KAH3936325.1 hypothetical protein HBH54_031770 [Parastagonospora nodorum]KAH3968630.1 hypothetical protein HBH51_130460 [Parastagonospora nodorum]KAH4056834.1 hypothetical protein HBH49_037880 [Parastagonospora nodorum]
MATILHQAYIGTYASDTETVIIWSENGVLHIKQRNAPGDEEYLIEQHPVTCLGWPANLFPVGRLAPNLCKIRPKHHKGSAGHMVTFFRSASAPDMIEKFYWRTKRTSKTMCFIRDNSSPLIRLPNELQKFIYDYVLSTDNILEGDLHLFEEHGVFRFAETAVMPFGSERKRFEGDTSTLPLGFNNLQYVCRHIRAMTRGLDLHNNHIKCHGWTFDSFHRNLINASLLSSIRKVTLYGDFTLGHCPDENVLHGLIKFGFDHPKATINIHVEAWQPQGTNETTMGSFMSMAYCIREAIRGELRPAWSSGNDKRLRAWMRNKAHGALNAPNVKFFPYRSPNCTDAQWCHPKVLNILFNGTDRYTPFVNGHVGTLHLVYTVRSWYLAGI